MPYNEVNASGEIFNTRHFLFLFPSEVIVAEEISFIKALKEFFEISGEKMVREFKALTTQDKIELSEMLMPIIPHVAYEPPSIS